MAMYAQELVSFVILKAHQLDFGRDVKGHGMMLFGKG